jgi:hypothetical protein
MPKFDVYDRAAHGSCEWAESYAPSKKEAVLKYLSDNDIDPRDNPDTSYPILVREEGNDVWETLSIRPRCDGVDDQCAWYWTVEDRWLGKRVKPPSARSEE